MGSHAVPTVVWHDELYALLHCTDLDSRSNEIGEEKVGDGREKIEIQAIPYSCGILHTLHGGVGVDLSDQL
jgi:hypothetical protein